MSHPEPDGPADRTPIRVGEVWENPVTKERATILERPWDNPEGRATAELVALVGARVMGEHCHPAIVEKFSVLEGELTVKRAGQISILHQGEAAVVEPGVWHDWWNAGTRDARVRVEVTPGERFVHMIETFFGLARLGYTDGKGMPYPLQLALTAPEFSDVVVFRSPPAAVQRALFGGLAPIARWKRLSGDLPAAVADCTGASNVALNHSSKYCSLHDGTRRTPNGSNETQASENRRSRDADGRRAACTG